MRRQQGPGGFWEKKRVPAAGVAGRPGWPRGIVGSGPAPRPRFPPPTTTQPAALSTHPPRGALLCPATVRGLAAAAAARQHQEGLTPPPAPASRPSPPPSPTHSARAPRPLACSPEPARPRLGSPQGQRLGPAANPSAGVTAHAPRDPAPPQGACAALRPRLPAPWTAVGAAVPRAEGRTAHAHAGVGGAGSNLGSNRLRTRRASLSRRPPLCSDTSRIECAGAELLASPYPAAALQRVPVSRRPGLAAAAFGRVLFSLLLI